MLSFTRGADFGLSLLFFAEKIKFIKLFSKNLLTLSNFFDKIALENLREDSRKAER